MDTFDLYKDIQCRTNGEIYLGVVGPVTEWQINLYQAFYGCAGAAENDR